MSTAALSRNQQAFATELARATGLDPRLIAAWVLAEEPAGAITPVGHNDQNWLNVGNTDAKWYAGARAWKDPVTAARLTAAWLRGTYSVPGFGRAAPGIVAFSRTAGRLLPVQIDALQKSGWASSGYPSLPGLVSQVSTGLTSTAAPADAPSPPDAGGGFGGWLAKAGLTAALLVGGGALIALGVSLLFKPLPKLPIAAAAAAA